MAAYCTSAMTQRAVKSVAALPACEGSTPGPRQERSAQAARKVEQAIKAALNRIASLRMVIPLALNLREV